MWQCLYGSGFVDSCRQRYKQAARHALGHIDMGYTLYKCWTCTAMPIRLRFIATLQVRIRSTARGPCHRRGHACLTRFAAALSCALAF